MKQPTTQENNPKRQRRFAPVTGSAAARCKQTLSGWRPYWQHGQDNECGKKAHWLWKSSLRGELPLCTRHAKAVGLDKCKPLKPQNDPDQRPPN